jgi:hypothetical protein
MCIGKCQDVLRELMYAGLPHAHSCQRIAVGLQNSRPPSPPGDIVLDEGELRAIDRKQMGTHRRPYSSPGSASNSSRRDALPLVPRRTCRLKDRHVADIHTLAKRPSDPDRYRRCRRCDIPPVPVSGRCDVDRFLTERFGLLCETTNAATLNDGKSTDRVLVGK